MEVLGFAEVAIKSLKLPGDFRKRMASDHVKELAVSYEEVGQLHEPIVRSTDKLLIAGSDRVAAHVIRKAEKILVKLVDCTDEEAEYVKHTENVRRRHEPKQRALDLERMIALESARQARKIAKGPQALPPEDISPATGKPIAEVTVARREIAKKKGVKPEAVRRAHFRAKARQREAEKVEKVVVAQAEGKVIDTAPISPIDDLGFPLGAEWLLQVTEVKRLVELASQRASDALGALTQLSNRALPFPDGRLQRLRQDMQAAATAIRMSIPKCLCPFCKGQPEYQPTCSACVGHGYITAGQMDHVPEAAWKQDVVMVDGKVKALNFDAPLEEQIEQANKHLEGRPDFVVAGENVGDLGGGW
jgi:ParB-like chromosome segregation protein Spo0J